MIARHHSFVRNVLPILSVLALAFGLPVRSQSAEMLSPITDMSIRRATVRTLTSFVDEAVTAIDFLIDESGVVCGTDAGRVLALALDDGRLMKVFPQHDAAVTSVSVSPDGQWVASSAADGWVHVSHLIDEALSFSLHHAGAVYEAEFSPQGTYLASVGDFQGIRWWTTNTWDELPPILGHSGPVYALAFSPAEDLLITGAGEADPSVRLWETATGVELQNDLYEGTVYDIEYSPRERDRHATIAGTQRTVWLWDVDRGAYLHLVGRFQQAVNDVAYASVGNALVAVSEDGSLFYTTMPAWTEKRRLFFEDALWAVVFSDSRLYVAFADAAGRLYLLTVPSEPAS